MTLSENRKTFFLKTLSVLGSSNISVADENDFSQKYVIQLNNNSFSTKLWVLVSQCISFVLFFLFLSISFILKLFF